MNRRQYIHRFVVPGCLALFLCGVSVIAQSAVPDPPAKNSEVQGPVKPDGKVLSYKGEGSIYLGFRLVGFDEISRAMDYEEGDSSLVLGINSIACPLPHRYHAYAEYFGPHSFYGDFGYAYKDLLLFRDLLTGVYYNLDHYDYLYPGSSPSLVYLDRSTRDDNFVDFVKNELLLRLKAPDFPLHSFVKHRYVAQEGAVEERFLLGSFGNMTKVLQSRDIDWRSNDLTLGLNSHLGPVEMEFTHSQGEFDPGSGSILSDFYPPAFAYGRPPDTYPLNVVPETEYYAHSLKLHSSFTGQIVASATLSRAKNTNNYSDAESEAWKAAMDFRWLPDPVIGIFFKYRHREQDRENPDRVVLNGFVHHLAYRVRTPVSTSRDLFSLAARYRPMGRLTMIGSYALELRERADTEEWPVLPESSDVHQLSFNVQARPLDTLKLKGVYEYRHYANPSYNTEPDNSNNIRLNATYTPTTWLTALIDYNLTLSQRDELSYINTVPRLVLNDGERDGRKDHFFGSLSFVFSPKASLTASWAYNRWELEQDMAYALWNTAGSGGSLPFYDRGATYTDEANTLSLSLQYLLRKDLTLTTDVSYTTTEGRYQSADVVRGVPASLSSFSPMEAAETFFAVGLDKKMFQDWEVGVRFSASFYDDEYSDVLADHRDGELYITTVSLKRYF